MPDSSLTRPPADAQPESNDQPSTQPQPQPRPHGQPLLQVAIDCTDVHGLNRFWAELLGYEIEHHDAQIRQLLSLGVATVDDTVELDGTLWWATAAACRDPEGRGARLLFQQVPESKVVKNRVHLDVHIGEGRDEVIARCIERGATRLWDGAQGPHTWVTLADPEGNEFCIS